MRKIFKEFVVNGAAPLSFGLHRIVYGTGVVEYCSFPDLLQSTAVITLTCFANIEETLTRTSRKCMMNQLEVMKTRIRMIQ